MKQDIPQIDHTVNHVKSCITYIAKNIKATDNSNQMYFT